MKKYENIQPSFDTNRQVLGEILPLDTPFTVIIDSSETCNFRCQYCFRADKDKSKWGYAQNNQMMEWDTFVRIIEQIQEFPQTVRQISLSNHGEPLTNRNLPEMVRYIKKQGIDSRVSIHTNAALLNEDYAKDLADSNIDRIVVSLQGLSSEKYKEVCGAEIDFNVFYHNLSILYEHKRDTQIYFKIMDVALDDGEEEKFYEMFSPIGDRVYVEKMVPIWKDVNFESIGKSSSKEMIYNKYGDGFPKQECCPLIFHTIVVLPNGDVYPCTQLLQKEKLGNIQGNLLVELWNSKKRKGMLMDQCNLAAPEICKDCGIRQNSIYAKEDTLDAYREVVKQRLEERE